MGAEGSSPGRARGRSRGAAGVEARRRLRRPTRAVAVAGPEAGAGRSRGGRVGGGRWEVGAPIKPELGIYCGRGQRAADNGIPRAHKIPLLLPPSLRRAPPSPARTTLKVK